MRVSSRRSQRPLGLPAVSGP
ncbi:hypothetical protein EYF80_065632 [Liparis tanakae]|uniref:Uncharacterized protein n=1 Tax=Liparis tanakae TaxID=230148 RepID=A0A4Z2E640_9TELE|nr:hypothetical protein EYF80_065632 [Liparis tanakae]